MKFNSPEEETELNPMIIIFLVYSEECKFIGEKIFIYLCQREFPKIKNPNV